VLIQILATKVVGYRCTVRARVFVCACLLDSRTRNAGAIYNDYDAVVAQLLKAGARVDDGVEEIKGYAPIHIAIASEQVCMHVHVACRLLRDCVYC
jgi:hypothetical protein